MDQHESWIGRLAYGVIVIWMLYTLGAAICGAFLVVYLGVRLKITQIRWVLLAGLSSILISYLLIGSLPEEGSEVFHSSLCQYVERGGRHKVRGLEYLKKDTPYIFANSPHGGRCIGSIFLFNKLRMFLPSLKYLVFPGLFLLPVWNIILHWAGLRPGGRESFKRSLREGRGIFFIPGGMRDIYYAEEQEETISIPKGWIKYALQMGSTIVPIYHFGETSALRPARLPLLKERIQVLPYTGGALIFISPHRIWDLKTYKIVSVIGRPLRVPKIIDPLSKDIRKWHRRYCRRLLRLVDKHKVEAGYPDLQVCIQEADSNLFDRRRRCR